MFLLLGLFKGRETIDAEQLFIIVRYSFLGFIQLRLTAIHQDYSRAYVFSKVDKTPSKNL